VRDYPFRVSAFQPEGLASLRLSPRPQAEQHVAALVSESKQHAWLQQTVGSPNISHTQPFGRHPETSGTHAEAQTPLVHVAPFWHTFPQLPQLFGSLVTSTHWLPQLVRGSHVQAPTNRTSHQGKRCHMIHSCCCPCWCRYKLPSRISQPACLKQGHRYSRAPSHERLATYNLSQDERSCLHTTVRRRCCRGLEAVQLT